jgi:flagellar biosynthesis/type III secretory pathway M-ring protein FliF/YscJ
MNLIITWMFVTLVGLALLVLLGVAVVVVMLLLLAKQNEEDEQAAEDAILTADDIPPVTPTLAYNRPATIDIIPSTPRPGQSLEDYDEFDQPRPRPADPLA